AVPERRLADRAADARRGRARHLSGRRPFHDDRRHPGAVRWKPARAVTDDGTGGPPQFRRAAQRATVPLTALVLVRLAGPALLGGPVAALVSGEAYAGVAALMPLAGVVALLRCVAASQGFVLLALNQQAYRFMAVLGALGVFVA